MDREKVIKGLEILMNGCEYIHCDDCCFYISTKPTRCGLREKQIQEDALDLLKEQEEQKRKWLQTIADTQLAISPTGYESEDELAKRGWEWNGLQMAWEIIAGEERSEHPRLVRCKDCKHWYFADNRIPSEQENVCERNGIVVTPDWYCADGERRTDDA